MSTPKPLLVYDGNCGFCRAWVARWRHVTRDRVEYAPFQEVASRFPDVPLARFAEAVQLLEPDGRWTRGAEAVFRALAHCPGRGWPLWLYRNVPGFAGASEAVYRFVAGHRPALSRVTAWLWGPEAEPAGETRVCWIYLRLLAVTYGVAFVSLWTQILGLAGSGGILPARELLEAARAQAGPIRYWILPTLCWLDASDGFLIGLCAAGTALSALLALGFAPVLSLIGLWVTYLSLATVCRDFLWFQWDSLLLEAGLISVLLAPWRWWSRPGSDPPPGRGALWLLRWLLFRLMFSSAVVKLGSGDPSWRDLTALTYHYETQPLPPWTAWYAHHLPVAFQRASTAVMFVIEGVAPFLVFAPRRLRFAAGAGLVCLQALIAATGNYGFFNLLSLALCLLVLDDAVLPRWLAPGAPACAGTAAAPRRGVWPPWLARPVVAALLAASLVPLFDTLRWPSTWLGPLPGLARLAAPLRSADRYGLFAVMTKRRPEIILEGSRDGIHWLPYEFRYKPGDLSRRPAFMAPHMPRLDWQMWFAALGEGPRDYWYLSFCKRLLEGSPPVRALLARDPFEGRPPAYLRGVVYDYRFTDAATRAATGAWWRREERGPFGPVLTLEEGRLRAVSLGPPAAP